MYLLIVYLLVAGPVITQYIGPYDLYVTDMGECEDVGTHEVIIRFRVSKTLKNRVHLTGPAVLPYGWTDQLDLLARMAKYQKNGKVKKDFYVKKFGGLCTSLKTVSPDSAKEFTLALANTRECPVKPGNYNMDGEMSFLFKAVPVFMYGKIRTDLELFAAKSGKKVGCFYFTSEVVPKRSTRRKG